MNQSTIKVFRKIIPNGIEISLARKKYSISYPAAIWREFSESYRQTFADSLAYATTMHLCMNGHANIQYNFPHPDIEPYLFESLMYSFGETTLIGEDQLKVSDLIKKFYNRNLNIRFYGRTRNLRNPKAIVRNSRNRAVIPFSFGKDSLLTFALTQELGIDPSLIFFREPRSPFENRHKRKLAERFFEEFGTKVVVFPVGSGWLRQTFGNWWGWDLLLTQYTLLLIPYLFALRARYLFWAHEQSCNDFFVNEEGFNINPVFEQSIRWLLTSNNLARSLGSNAIFSSLLEPIHEIAIIQILHHRFPKIAKYQMSCFSEEDSAASKRWCGQCSKCARMHIFMLGLGIDPATVGMNQTLLGLRKKQLYSLFDAKRDESGTYDVSGLGRSEQLLAFLLAYKRGVKGELIKEFEKKYLLEARSREKELREKYFGIHSTQSLPYSFRNTILKIYRAELSGLS